MHQSQVCRHMQYDVVCRLRMCRVSVLFAGLIICSLTVSFLTPLHQHQSIGFVRDEKPVSLKRTKKSSVQEEIPALRLKRFLTTPTTSCRKLRSVGGRSCLGALDGAKLVCLDAGVFLKPGDCLIYSFGVGNDFSFDQHMQDYGCEVHAFDHDSDHEIYDYRIGPKVFFHKSRIGFKTGYFKYCENSPSGAECNPFIHYETFEDIRRLLGHVNRPLNYLKMDIEGGEWIVLNDIIESETALNATSQISLEIHFDDIRTSKSIEEKRTHIAKYLNVFDKLSNIGFHLMHFEENEFNPQYEMVDGVQLAVYAEILLSRKVTW